HLERNRFIAFIHALQKQGFLVEKQSDYFVLSMKGKKWLENEKQTGEQLYINGQQYRQSDKIFHRLQLLVQVWTNMKMKNKQRSEEQTSELQSRFELVCRLLLE